MHQAAHEPFLAIVGNISRGKFGRPRLRRAHFYFLLSMTRPRRHQIFFHDLSVLDQAFPGRGHEERVALPWRDERSE